MSVKDKVVSLLVAGVKPTNISAAVGCDESYVSQVSAECREQILAARSQRTESHIEHDLTLDNTEDRALQKVGRLLDTVTDPIKALSVFKVLNAAKRRHESLANQQTTGAVVQLELPQIAKVAIRMSSDKQVIEVAGRSMVTMQAAQVEAMMNRRKAEQQEAIVLLEDKSHNEMQVAESTMSLLERL
jgi:hypothetical protein